MDKVIGRPRKHSSKQTVYFEYNIKYLYTALISTINIVYPLKTYILYVTYRLSPSALVVVKFPARSEAAIDVQTCCFFLCLSRKNPKRFYHIKG